MKQNNATTTTSTEVATTEPTYKLAVNDQIISALDAAAKQGMFAQSVTNEFKKMFIMGGAMSDLRALLTPEVMKPIMALQNTPIGFLTDKPAGGYPVDVVRDCVIEAAFNGVSVCGNEFNIIAARFYPTKNGLKHKLRDIVGLYKNVTPGIPKMVSENGSIVTMHVDWTFAGEHHEKDLTLAIRVNRGMGADAIIGKATRKVYAWLFEEVTGNSVNEGDVTDDVQMIEAQPIEAQATTTNETQTAEATQTETKAADAESDLKLEQM